MKIEGQITISAPSGDGCDYIEIQLHDEKACIRFCEARIKYADFAKLLTGLARIPCEIEVLGLENVGKMKEHKSIQFLLPGDYGSHFTERKMVAKETVKNLLPDGWICTDSFSSQGSFFHRGNEPWARATIHRWLERGNDGRDTD